MPLLTPISQRKIPLTTIEVVTVPNLMSCLDRNIQLQDNLVKYMSVFRVPRGKVFLDVGAGKPHYYRFGLGINLHRMYILI